MTGRLVAVLGLLTSAILLSGCGGPATPHQDEQGRYVIRMSSDSFRPQHATVPLNATVVWVNDSTAPHDVQGGTGNTSFSSGDFGAMNRGATFEHKFTEPGHYEYYCYIHHGIGMTATLDVAK